jgi:hypothetical protein
MRTWVRGAGFGVWGAGLGVWGAGSGAWGAGFGVAHRVRVARQQELLGPLLATCGGAVEKITGVPRS